MAESTEMLPNSSEDCVLIEIEEPNKLLATQMGKKLSETFPISSQCCIYRVPNVVCRVSENAYVPQIISIGPFHRDKEKLQATERFKWLYLYSLLDRVPQTNLECLIDAMRKLEQVCRECYEEYINLSSNEFVEMMLIDGCFILEMFRRDADEVPIDSNDHVFGMPRMQLSIRRDMILLENQIPLLILQCLFDLTTVPEHKGRSLIELCHNSLDEIMSMGIDWRRRNTSLKGKHLLDLVHNSFIPRNLKMGHVTMEDINCATELHEAGVTFKKKDNASSLFDITFNDGVGVFMIPPLIVEDNTETLFRNLIALEQCYGRCYFITSYVYLMDNLISSAKDVELLRNKRIIINNLGSDEEVSLVINNLCKEVVLGDFQYTKLYQDVTEYYRNICHKWQATLKREYFNTPWKVLSFFAAILLLILTTAATLFAVLSYSVHGS